MVALRKLCSPTTHLTTSAVLPASWFSCTPYAQVDLKSQFVTDSTGALEMKGTGLVAKTAEALESVPLIVAPLLEQDVLSQVCRRLHVLPRCRHGIS